MTVAHCDFQSPRHRRVLLMLGYYEHRMHRGVARYARQARWILDTTMAHYGRTPDCRRCDGALVLVVPDQRDLARAVRRLRAPVVDLVADVPGIDSKAAT